MGATTEAIAPVAISGSDLKGRIRIAIVWAVSLFILLLGILLLVTGGHAISGFLNLLLGTLLLPPLRHKCSVNKDARRGAIIMWVIVMIFAGLSSGNEDKAQKNATTAGTQLAVTEGSLSQFLQKNGFKKENNFYRYYPDISHHLKPHLALTYKFDSIGLKQFELSNWMSAPKMAAMIPAEINNQLESMERQLLIELLGTTLGSKLDPNQASKYE